MKRNIDNMNDQTLNAYFEMVYQESLEDSEIPYKYELASRTEWIEWHDKRIEWSAPTMHDIFTCDDIWVQRKKKEELESKFAMAEDSVECYNITTANPNTMKIPPYCRAFGRWSQRPSTMVTHHHMKGGERFYCDGCLEYNKLITWKPKPGDVGVRLRACNR